MNDQQAPKLRSFSCERCGKRWWHDPNSRAFPTDSRGNIPDNGNEHLKTGVFEWKCVCGADCMVPLYKKRK